MAKKWKKPGAAEKHSGHDPKPPDGCRYNPASIQTVTIKEAPNDEQWKTDQKGFWGKQISRATCLNIITAIGVLFTGIAAGGALVYALIVYNQWRDANHNFMVDERPWLQIPVRRLTLKAGSPIEAIGEFNNSGKTPAIQVQADYSLKTSPTLIDIATYINSPSRPAPSMTTRYYSIFPNSPPFKLAVRTEQSASQHFVDIVNAKNEFIYFFGKITYSDYFGGTHFTTFCSVWMPDDAAFAPCEGNYERAN